MDTFSRLLELPKHRIPAKSRAATRTGSSRRVLIVDDYPQSAESLGMILALRGHETRTASDGLEAIEIAERFRPQVVLLDINLPGVSGYEACRRIRREAWGKDVVVLAMTGWEEDRDSSAEAGFDGHLVKPVDVNVLMDLLGDRH